MTERIDARGYAGGEKNRQLTREQVVWARRAAFEQRATAAEIRAALARVGVNMSTDSVRRMLRGETYGNVGVQLPRAASTLQPPPGGQVELVPLAAADVEASAERLRAMLGDSAGQRPGPNPAPTQGNIDAGASAASVLDRLAADIETAKAQSGDGMLAELAGEPPGEPPADPFAPAVDKGSGPTQRPTDAPNAGALAGDAK